MLPFFVSCSQCDSSLSKMALDSFHQWIYRAQKLVCIVELQIWATYDNRIILLYSKRADTHATVCHLRPARCKIACGCGCLIDLSFFYSAALTLHRECVGMYHSDPNTLFLLTGRSKVVCVQQPVRLST